MKKFILLIACSISFLYIVSVSAETVDGFRGIKCGDPLEKWQKEMKYEGENKANQTKAYMRKNDSLQIGNAKLLHVTYIFYENKFVGITLGAKGSMNCDNLKTATFAKYGDNPTQPNKHIEEYFWILDSAKISYKYNDISEQCNVNFYCTKLVENLQTERKTKAKEGAKSGF